MLFVHDTDACWPYLDLHCSPPLPPALLHPQQQWASWVGQGEGAGLGVPLQTSWLVVLLLLLYPLHAMVTVLVGSRSTAGFTWNLLHLPCTPVPAKKI